MNRFSLFYHAKKRRICIDCLQVISDKRFSISSQGKRCKKCQKAYRERYLHDYWQHFKQKYLAKRKTGTLHDKYTDNTIQEAIDRDKLRSGKMVKIRKTRYGRDSYYDFEYDVSPEKLRLLKQQYGDKNITVL